LQNDVDETVEEEDVLHFSYISDRLRLSVGGRNKKKTQTIPATDEKTGGRNCARMN
jgi:hypothetical protein